MKKVWILVLAAVLLVLFAATASAEGPAPEVLSGEQCKMCHAAQYEEWAATAHPKSIEDVKASDHGSEACLHCMSTDYRYDETLTVETAQYGVTCVACHAPHETPGDAKPKIADVAEVCKDCHNGHLAEGAAEFEAGSTVRHPTKEMMAGVGAIGVASVPSKHDMDCTTCHQEGHKYEAKQEACDTCHGGGKTIEGVAALFAPRLEELGAMETLAEDHPAAYTNYTMLLSDASNGVHNVAYATAILNAIDAALGAAPAALPVTGGKLAGWPVWATVGLMALGLASLTAGAVGLLHGRNRAQ
ncbi:MAG: hypothetical protein H5T59_02185 [Anaerolineae bacterium]|nr:hypothetical protein [Anaerolineae bacterium]